MDAKDTKDEPRQVKTNVPLLINAPQQQHKHYDKRFATVLETAQVATLLNDAF